MANHPSAAKAARQALRHREANKTKITRVKSVLKNVRSATTKAAGEALLKETNKLLDKMASQGIIHKNKAASQKSKLSKFVKKLA